MFLILLGHVPPSSELYKSGICQLYENIIRKYSNMIMAQFFGHT